MASEPDPLASDLAVALGRRYQLGGLVGEGGSARVYQAWDFKHQRTVAVKIIHGRGSALRSASPRNEIRIIARLNHPSVLPLHDSGIAAGRPYFIMPLLTEPMLREVITDEGPLSTRATLQILRDVAEGLDYAHDLGVVHRDIKPENIAVRKGRGVIVDFGIAFATDSAPAGRTAPILGTLHYASPEQLRGDPVGPPSDVYSLASVAFEMLTGRPPYRGFNRSLVAARKVAGDLEEVRAGASSLHNAMRLALESGLSLSPDARPGSAGAFVEALSEAALARHRRRLAATVVTGGFALVAVSAALTRASVALPALVGDRIVAGLIEDRTGTPALAAVGPMLSDQITEGLQRTGLVDVVPTLSAVMAEKVAASAGEETDPISLLARETRAGVVVSGWYGRLGDQLQIRLEVTDAVEGRLLGALPLLVGHVEEPGALVARARDRVMGFLATELDPRLSTFAIVGQQPTYSAYESFRAGVEQYLVSDWAVAAAAFLRAHAADSTFTTALLYAALSLSNTGDFRVSDSLLAEVDARRGAISLYHRYWLDYRMALLSGRRERALIAIRALARMSPGSKAVYNLGIEAMEQRRLRESVEALSSLPLDQGPVRAFVPHPAGLAIGYHALGMFEEELAASRRARNMAPDQLWPQTLELRALVALQRFNDASLQTDDLANMPRDGTGRSPAEVLADIADEVEVHGDIAQAGPIRRAAVEWLDAVGWQERLGDRLLIVRLLLALGEVDRAFEIAPNLEKQHPDNLGDLATLGLRGWAAAWSASEPTAVQILEDLVATDQPYLFGDQYRHAAIVASALGDDDRAIQLLRQGFDRGMSYGLWLHTHPAFRSLRQRSDFVRLLEPVDVVSKQSAGNEGLPSGD